ncbi:hypothetical protein LWH48_15055 [Halomonas sp. G15]|uniref:hypothetical protein n=1 Tax=Halomonas sp. G15 TaxID=2903521 RepID=UPI001E43FBC9|nr:hypothetical protein [Halomonas sp. G15]MCE0734085.1 hypothetical protein [Halomonas sp. G15]
MQPVKTTELSTSEAVRSNLNSGNNGKTEGIVTSLPGFELMESGWRAGEVIAAPQWGAWLMYAPRPFFTRKRYQTHVIPLVMYPHSFVFRLVMM